MRGWLIVGLIWAAVLLVVWTLLGSPGANAQVALGPAICMPRDALADLLSSRYNEVQVAQGIQGQGSLLEVFVGPDGETWTIIVTRADGLSCATLWGKDWMPASDVNEGSGT